MALRLCVVSSSTNSRWPCTFCIDIHEEDGLLSAWAKPCRLHVFVLCVCLCEGLSTCRSYLCLPSGPLSRAKLSLVSVAVCFALLVFAVVGNN